MPHFISEKKKYHNPVEFALEKIGGRWKMPILWRISKKSPWRYGELKKDLEGISHKMLSAQLKELEKDGLIKRKSYPVIPPKVEYSLTVKGREVIPAIEELRKLGNFLKEKNSTEQSNIKKV
ncbi:MAG: helix-turn-helix domain-containing protein [Patescibacteria group bacterium]|nr:helix-turn-helix domain-containing protein [Patescibacteria group bacterium]